MSSLWVGNLAGDVTDADLTNLFGKYGVIISLTSYSTKFFAFVHFKLPEDAKTAKEALQGTIVRGNPLRIDFAKPAKPCRSLWVGGISPSVTKEELEEHFRRFGKIQEFKFLRERNTAYVDYFMIEDATKALKNLNGFQIGGNLIRVDYLRSQPLRKELPDFRDARETQFLNRSTGTSTPSWIPQNALRNFSDPYGSIRPQHVESPVGPKGDGQPSKVLWVSFPPSFPMDKQMLHNAMILFGEIEGITLFPSGNYSLVEFRSVEEAKRAKEGLEGRLFSDPRILILYSNSDIAPSNDQSCFYPGIKGPRTDVLSTDIPCRPGIIPNSLPGNLPPRGVSGPDMLRRPVVPQGNFEPLQQGPDFSLTAFHKLQESNTNILIGGLNQKRLSPSPGVLSSPSQAMKPSVRPVSGAWDVFDVSQLERESKRSRVGGLSAKSDPSLENMDDHGLGLDQFHGHGDGGIRGATTVRGMNHFSPVDSRVLTGGTVQGHPEHDCIWRGVIAKGGQHVCHARCVPFEKEFEFEIPEVVNCSARTGLDLLAKHYGDAVGFNIIFFLPDSEEDFAPYTEFLRYLGANNRAGVAKFDDGTTLFLVPPSDFLKNTLNIAGPERLYGVVLKFQNHVLGSSTEHTHLAQQNYIDRPMMPSQFENKVIPQEERFLQTDYKRFVHENRDSFSKSLAPSTNPISGHAVPATSTSLSQAGVTLTPELIATLASLLPAKGNTVGAQPLSVSSNPRPMPTPGATDRGHPQGWDYEQTKLPEQSSHLISQAVNQYNPQRQFLLDHHYSLGQNAHTDAAQGVTANNQIQDATFNMRQHGDASSTQITNFVAHPHGGQYIVSPHTNRQCQVETKQETRHGYAQGNNASVPYSASPLLPITNSVTLLHQVSNSTISQGHSGIPMAGENIGFDSQKHHPLQSHPGSVQGTLDEETDKNERYRSTLQFAANLLLQIKQNPGSETVQGPGNS